MNALLIQTICLAGFLSINSRAGEVELTKSADPDHQGESGVMTQGTIFDISSDQIVILPSGSQKPIRYFHGEGTVYVDESGNSITLKVVRSGVEVTVFYSQAEEQRMANRVVVGKSRSPRST